MPFFHSFFFSSIQPSFSQLCSPVCIWGPICLPAAEQRWGPGPAPGGSKRREIPRTTGLVTDTPKPAAILYSTLYFPGKHLLSSLTPKLASNLPPHSCLVMPIRVYTAPALQRWRRKKVEKGHWEREMENEGREREGQGQSP